MFLWDPKQSQMAILFVITGFWGIAHAIWQTQAVGIDCSNCFMKTKLIH